MKGYGIGLAAGLLAGWLAGAEGAGFGLLRISSEPGGAEVRLDGEKVGATAPCPTHTPFCDTLLLKLPAGEYRLRMTTWNPFYYREEKIQVAPRPVVFTDQPIHWVLRPQAR